jgi:tRNA (pseudouridine54-N1)-methyltransferase
MLRFIQVLPDVSPKGDFILKDLPGSGKRVDVLCRCLAACFDWSIHTWTSKNLEFIAVIGEELLLTFKVRSNTHRKGEVWWATAVKDALQGNPPEGVTVTPGTTATLIPSILGEDNSQVYVLEEHGAPISLLRAKLQETSQNSFMLGDHRGFSRETLELLDALKVRRISLGPVSYLSSHCVAAIIAEFERRQ